VADRRGVGAFARLRGKGTLTGSLLTGDPSNPPTVAFRATWRGVVAFDDVAPTLGVTRATAAKLQRPRGAYRVQIAFSAVDDVSENAVACTARLLGPTFQHKKSGRTTTGTVALTFTTHPARTVRRLRLEITGEDPFGNRSVLTRAVTLPR
jgi:hypothetical protein